MLDIDNHTPCAAHLLALSSGIGVLCVLKTRFCWQPESQAWVRDSRLPEIQSTENWGPGKERQFSDLSLSKQYSELLIKGAIRSQACLQIQEGGLWHTVCKIGNVSPSPTLFWQDEYSPPKKQGSNQIAPKYARFAQDWSCCEGLCFERLFAFQAAQPATSVYFMPESKIIQGQIVDSDTQQAVGEAISFVSDTLVFDLETGSIDQLWRAQFPWDLMADRWGRLSLSVVSDTIKLGIA